MYLKFTDITFNFCFLRIKMGYSESPRFLCLLLLSGSWKRVFLWSLKRLDV